MQKRLFAALACFLALASGCAAHGPVRLQGDFLMRGQARVGVALGKVASPGIRDRNGGYGHLWPFISAVPEYDDIDVFSEKGNEQERKRLPGTLEEGPRPPVQGELYSLRSLMDVHGSDALRRAVSRFAQGLERPGWLVVPLEVSVGEVKPDAPHLKGLDALIILDFTWYGAFCHDAGIAGDLADTGADLTGRMIDLSTGELLWRSPVIRIRNPVWCRCSDPACYADIAGGLGGAVNDAQEAALKDFLGKTP
jgi:hypothetical protein